MLEERFYWALVYFRWIDPGGWKVMREHWFGTLPPGAKQVLPELVRRRVKNQLMAHGFGRHSEAEMMALARDDLASVSAVLADKAFFFGEQGICAAASGFGSSVVAEGVCTRPTT